MEFDRILEQWEKLRGNSGPRDSAAEEPGQKRVSVPADWLENYLPDAGTVAAREIEHKTPVSEGRSIWLRRPPQDVLDLHGFRGLEAREELTRFVHSMRRRGLRKGLVIHGKGNHSAEGSVLAPLVREFLEMSPDIGEFGRGVRKDGGSGVTWFILRQRSR
jgi:DNA-nicking Smr family endonuclease